MFSIGLVYFSHSLLILSELHSSFSNLVCAWDVSDVFGSICIPLLYDNTPQRRSGIAADFQYPI